MNSRHDKKDSSSSDSTPIHHKIHRDRHQNKTPREYNKEHQAKHNREPTTYPTMFTQTVEVHIEQTPKEETPKCDSCFGSIFKCFS